MERNCTDYGPACRLAGGMPQPLQAAASSARKRPIFASYWEKQSGSPCRSSPTLVWSRSGKYQQPKHRRFVHNKTFAYIYYDRDPYQFFGIREDGDERPARNIDPLNLYEHVLQQDEAGFVEQGGTGSSSWPIEFRSCFTVPFVHPFRYCTIGREYFGAKNIVDGKARTVNSDTVLIAKRASSLPKQSCLRKSRFSSDGCIDSSSTRDEKGEQRTLVSFESKTEVHLFQVPVEKWAPNGWSSWFGE